MAKIITIRFPEELYQKGSELAHTRQISMSALIRESLRAAVKQEAERQLFVAFGAAGEDHEEADVEFALAAQWEVMQQGV